MSRFEALRSGFRHPSWIVEGRPWIGWLLVGSLVLLLLTGIAFILFALVIIFLVAQHGAGDLHAGVTVAIWWFFGLFSAVGITFFRLWWNYGRSFAGKSSLPDLGKAQAGDGAAAHRLGLHYLAVDPASARAWLLRAAQAGETGAMVDLARMLRDGKGGFRDPNAARLWLSRALEAGHPDAATLLADLESRLGDTFTQRGI